ncbi:hypothetical protein RDI58_026913 [Solanum bulbocastanum]
MKPNR